jgi:MoaD family protein
MKVEVEFFANLRDIVGGSKRVEKVSEGCTILDLLKILSERYGKEFRDFIFDHAGEVHPFVTIMINEKEYMKSTTGFDVELKEGDKVAILLPVAGGRR